MTTLNITTARGTQLRIHARPVLPCKTCRQAYPHDVVPPQAGGDEALAFCQHCRTGRAVALTQAQPLARVDQLLAERPDLSDFPAVGVCLHRAIREGA